MQIDQYSFEKTAEAVFALNPSVSEKFESVKDLEYFMVGRAYEYMGLDKDKITFFGTYGFYLSGYKTESGDMMVQATVSPGIVLSYLEQKKEAAWANAAMKYLAKEKQAA